MATKRLDEHDWARYFNDAASTLRGRKATVEVVAPDIGAQFAAVGLDVIGIAYDPKNRLLEVALDGMDHLIRHPQEIYVDETPHGLAVVEATDGSGRKHIVQITGY
ncbi:MAG TPA: DUF5335 family protein [Skermanella sp.]|jgi:hypothetical protein|nr:DUF5335 family protein [Skermanella sp.]